MHPEIAHPPQPHGGSNGLASNGRPAATTLIHIWPSNAADEEDTALTAYLASAWRKLHTASHRPPRCPRCRSGKSAYDGSDHKGLPQFLCHQCKRRFNRLTGTPMARLRPDESTLLAFFRLAARHTSVAEAARRLGINAETVVRWSVQTRLWLLELDPRGSWEHRVQLAVRYAVIPAGQQHAAPALLPACRCSPVRSDAPAEASSDALLLLRICPLCEQAGHLSPQGTGNASSVEHAGLPLR